MKKSNLLKVMLFGALCATLAIISMFFLWSSMGLVLTLFASVSAFICLAELESEFRPASIFAIILQITFTLVVLFAPSGISIKSGVLITGTLSLLTLFSGLIATVIRVKKMMKTRTVSVLILGILFMLNSCGEQKQKKEPETFKVSYFGTKSLAESNGYVITQAFNVSTINDSTIGQRGYLLMVDTASFNQIVGRYKNNPHKFDVMASEIITKTDDTIYFPCFIDDVNDVYSYYHTANVAYIRE